MPISKGQLPALMPGLVKMYNSGNAVVDIRKSVFWMVALNMKEDIIFTSYKICVSALDEEEADYN